MRGVGLPQVAIHSLLPRFYRATMHGIAVYKCVNAITAEVRRVDGVAWKLTAYLHYFCLQSGKWFHFDAVERVSAFVLTADN